MEVFIEMVESGLIVVMVVGVNGLGKMILIVKFVNFFYKEGNKVLLGVGDMFWVVVVE